MFSSLPIKSEGFVIIFCFISRVREPRIEFLHLLSLENDPRVYLSVSIFLLKSIVTSFCLRPNKLLFLFYSLLLKKPLNEL